MRLATAETVLAQRWCPVAAVLLCELALAISQASHWWCLYVRSRDVAAHRHNLGATAIVDTSVPEVFAVASGKNRLTKNAAVR